MNDDDDDDDDDGAHATDIDERVTTVARFTRKAQSLINRLDHP